MSTGINIASSSGITVGTTPVTSGTDGRVFFQAGGVVQQSASLFWDNVNERLGVGGTPGAFRLDVNGTARVQGDFLATTFYIGTSTITNTVGFYTPTTNLLGIFTNGTERIRVGSTGNVLIGTITDAGFKLDVNGTTRLNGNTSIGGSTAGARLDVRAQGALTTDIAFRIRNSADTKNLANITGLGDVYLGDGVTVTNQGTEPLIAIGKGTTVNGIFNSSPIAIGNTTTAIGNSIAIGKGSSAGLSGVDNNIAIGYNAVAYGATGGISAGMAIGTNVSSSAFASGGIAVGISLTTTPQARANIVVGRYINSVNGFINEAFAFGSGVSDASRASLDVGDSFSIYINQNTRALFLNQKSNLVFRNGQSLTAATHFDANATNTFTIHNGTAPVTTIANAGQLYVEAGALRYRDGNGTITNAGGTVQSVASAATVTPVATNKLVKITAQAVGLTLAVPTGTIADGQDLMIRIKDSGSAQTITWTSGAGGYRAIGITLPTTTTAGKTTYVGLIYNSDDSRWDAIGVTTEV